MLNIPTEPIGSLPRPAELRSAIAATGGADVAALDQLFEHAIRDTIQPFEVGTTFASDPLEGH
jgi:5-methyltetrahydropteroyltriglutamate--homocysteine methyltransferase